MQDLLLQFNTTRAFSSKIANAFTAEDATVQHAEFASPLKWHLGHTTWFIETLILSHCENYKVFNSHFNYLFNSYYNGIGERVARDMRSFSRPSLQDIHRYRQHINARVSANFDTLDEDQLTTLQIGIAHEQQHQELMLQDIRYNLTRHLSSEVFNRNYHNDINVLQDIPLPDGVFEFGQIKEQFGFDNEFPRHSQLLRGGTLTGNLVTNGEFLQFIDSGGYHKHEYWLDAGWSWIKQHSITSPLYWHVFKDRWYEQTIKGDRKLDLAAPVTFISWYEAQAYAAYRGARLPTEFELEWAYKEGLPLGSAWQWTSSDYNPYPGYTPYDGKISEYNGKFMSGQYVLKGASEYTPQGHSRPTYRNF